MILLGIAGIFAIVGTLLLITINYNGDKSLLWKKVIVPKRRREFDMMTIETSDSSYD